jgi:hypothetical protein
VIFLKESPKDQIPEETFNKVASASPAASARIETLKRRVVIIDGAMGTMIQT